ncbi:MAG: nucleotidyl transferase AbiEii/AbiGii toxin family protein [Bacteroidetes bacterium]|nr:nucleotidyl transferase AbiEii/AbiGii toxin family protein [Bacteroidota bacterium]
MGLPLAAAVEKDWWVVRTLELVFQTEIAPNTVFKGGTSLSKAWKLIDRFSEDIDLALDRRFLGFEGIMTGSQVARLRKQSAKYISEIYLPQLKNVFLDYGFNEIDIQLVDIKSADEDPVKIAIKYPSVTEPSVYLASQVLIELGSRSLMEPQSNCSFSSFVGESFTGRDFADNPITIPTVVPERTFLEKIFLLHEEFQQPLAKIKAERKSRHLYDLEKIMDTEYGLSAMADMELYWHIVEHRQTMTRIRGIDYSNHVPKHINPIPPIELMDLWRRDYEQMQQSMIYRESLPFDRLMERISELKTRINNS